MNWLLLRGEVPKDRSPVEIIFDSIGKCDDVWSNFLYAMLDKNDYGEIWYYNGPYREHKLASNLMERWIPNFETYTNNIVFDFVFCRGGFTTYHPVLKRFPNAIKIYYGAGHRFLPQPGFFDYDIILQDSPEQVEICKEKFPEILITLFIKPAADNIFYPIECKKEHDVCFPANAAQAFKGHKFIYSTVPKDIKLLNLGNNPHDYRYPENVTSYRVLRKDMAKEMAKCKVGVVATQSHIDSCPRVISEILACGIPIVVLDGTRFWKEKYIISRVTGELTNRENFWDVVKHVLNNLEEYNPRKYYEENLSLNHAAKFLRGKIDEISI